MPTRDPDDELVVLFKYLAVKNETRSLAEGRPQFDDLEICEIRKPGSRDVKPFLATAFARWVIDPESGEQRQETYAERFSHQYRQFKARAAQTVAGTPLEYASFLTEARRAELRAQNVYTVEMLAAIDGVELKNLGPGGREMKNRATQFIDDARATAPSKQMLAELDALRARNSVLEEDAQRNRNTLQASAHAEFDDMNDDQLREYIVANTGKQPLGSLPRKTLVRMATEATSRAA